MNVVCCSRDWRFKILNTERNHPPETPKIRNGLVQIRALGKSVYLVITGIILLILQENICCDHSPEPSRHKKTL